MSNEDRELKRISLFIGNDQYEKIAAKGLNLSWLVRDLLDDHLSEKKINLNVSQETLELYQKIGESNIAEFEPFFREALREYLLAKIESMKKLERTAFKKSDGSKK